MADHDSRAGVRYADAALVAYCDDLHASLDAPLSRAFEAPDVTGIPAIMVGKSEGRLLHLLVGLSGARKAVEVGTLAGFSAIQIARALPADGHLWTIENEESHAHIARSNIEADRLDNKVTVVVADGPLGLEMVADNGPFDVVFLDADKERYDVYADWAIAHLRVGGMILVDNAYYFGQLLEDTEDATAVRTMHERVAQHFHSVCIPTPDGLVLGIKRP
jgi:caffeoyl-CoA O-methyltransferase